MSTLRRVVGIAALALGFALVAPTPMALAEQDLDCASFEYQEDAQEVLDSTPNEDPHGLDKDNDRIACEALPARPVQQPTETTTPPPVEPPAEPAEDQVEEKPAGGVDTGGLSDTGTDSDSGLLIVLGGLAVAGSAVAVAARRRATR